MLSGLDVNARSHFVTQIESLGGQVSNLSNYDPACTHLLLPSKPSRNEKTLSCIAAGKWILHASYVEESVNKGAFLNVWVLTLYFHIFFFSISRIVVFQEEEFEFGNPKSSRKLTSLGIEIDQRITAIHWWRKEIQKRGYGAFNDMRAIVVAMKRDPLVRVIEAGGGKVIEAT